MSLLYRVLFAWKCKSTHHKLAMDALLHLRDARAEAWRNLFLTNVEFYLGGSKAPDTKFKDFRNHVLHVGDNNWGGAPQAAEKWYARAVEAFQQKKWGDAVYAAGVLSHYYTDPLMPLHTGQTEAESAIHRPAEWSMTKSYDTFRRIIAEDSLYPDLQPPTGDDWLRQMVLEGARVSHAHYDAIVEQYDVHVGAKNPPAGLNEDLRRRIAGLIAHATIGFSRILDRAFADADVTPPVTRPSVHAALATMTIPIFWVTKRMADAKDRKVVRAMYRELQQTGRVLHTLPEDDKAVRKLHAEEVLKISVEELDRRHEGKAASAENIPQVRPSASTETNTPTSQKSEELASLIQSAKQAQESRRSHADESPKPTIPLPAARELRFYLKTSDAVVDAPSIGPKTAKRLRRIGVSTVAELLDADPAAAAIQLNARHIPQQTIVDWQHQAKLVCRVPELRGHDAQILVACGITDPETLHETDADVLLECATEFVKTSDGQRIIRSGNPPDAAEVAGWIKNAGMARMLQDAA